MNYWEIIGKVVVIALILWFIVKVIILILRDLLSSRGLVGDLRQAVLERDFYIKGLEGAIVLLEERLRSQRGPSEDEESSEEDDEPPLLN